MTPLGSLLRNGIFGLVIAAGVAYMLYRTDTDLIIQTLSEPRWAAITEFHVRWDVYTNTVEISAVVDKHAECRRTIVNKTIRPIKDDGVVPDQILLNGKLSEKIQEAQLGVSILFDRAKPRTPVPPGHYLVTLVALCEENKRPQLPVVEAAPHPPLADPTVVPPSPVTVSTEPVQAIIVVPKIEVRPVRPRGDG